MSLQARGLEFQYVAGHPVLASLDVSFEPGQVAGVAGPSGSGKSTLLYCLGLMLLPTSGEIRLDDRSVSGLTDRERAALRAQRFGFVFQDAVLDASRTVIDNITETAVYAGRPRESLMTRAKVLLDRVGLDLPLSRRPGEVSGGQAQRIALCRAIVHRPSVLLADEPTGNLDQVAGTLVLEVMREHAATGATVVVATHDPRVLERCDVVHEL